MKSILYGIMAALLAGSIATAMAMRSCPCNAGYGSKALDGGAETAIALRKLDRRANTQYVFQRNRHGPIRERMALAGAGSQLIEDRPGIIVPSGETGISGGATEVMCLDETGWIMVQPARDKDNLKKRKKPASWMRVTQTLSLPRQRAANRSVNDRCERYQDAKRRRGAARRNLSSRSATVETE